jgi:hypothetical protein
MAEYPVFYLNLPDFSPTLEAAIPFSSYCLFQLMVFEIVVVIVF